MRKTAVMQVNVSYTELWLSLSSRSEDAETGSSGVGQWPVCFIKLYNA